MHRGIDRKGADSGGGGSGAHRTQPCRDSSGKGSHQYRQNDAAAPNGPPAGARASRVYQIKKLEPRTIAAAKVAMALTIANGSIMIARPTPEP